MIAGEPIQFNGFDLSVKLNIIHLSCGIRGDYTGGGTIPGQIEVIIITDRSWEKCIGIYPCIAFPVENVSAETIAEDQKILVPYPEKFTGWVTSLSDCPKFHPFRSAPSLV